MKTQITSNWKLAQHLSVTLGRALLVVLVALVLQGCATPSHPGSRNRDAQSATSFDGTAREDLRFQTPLVALTWRF